MTEVSGQDRRDSIPMLGPYVLDINASSVYRYKQRQQQCEIEIKNVIIDGEECNVDKSDQGEEVPRIHLETAQLKYSQSQSTGRKVIPEVSEMSEVKFPPYEKDNLYTGGNIDPSIPFLVFHAITSSPEVHYVKLGVSSRAMTIGEDIDGVTINDDEPLSGHDFLNRGWGYFAELKKEHREFETSAIPIDCCNPDTIDFYFVVYRRNGKKTSCVKWNPGSAPKASTFASDDDAYRPQTEMDDITDENMHATKQRNVFDHQYTPAFSSYFRKGRVTEIFFNIDTEMEYYGPRCESTIQEYCDLSFDIDRGFLRPGYAMPVQICTDNMLMSAMIYLPEFLQYAPKYGPIEEEAADWHEGDDEEEGNWADGGTASLQNTGDEEKFPIFFYLHGDQSRSRKHCPMNKLPNFQFPNATSGPMKSLDELAAKFGNTRHRGKKLSDRQRFMLLRHAIIVHPLCDYTSYWFRGPPCRCDANQFHCGVVEALSKLRELIIERFRGDSSRVYLSGLSMGGYGCLELASLWGPQKVAGVIGCATSHETRAIPDCEEWFARRLCGIPVWFFHTPSDSWCKLEETLSLVQRLLLSANTKGLKDLKLSTTAVSDEKEYFTSHSSPGYVLDSTCVLKWLFQYRSGTTELIDIEGWCERHCVKKYLEFPQTIYDSHTLRRWGGDHGAYAYGGKRRSNGHHWKKYTHSGQYASKSRREYQKFSWKNWQPWWTKKNRNNDEWTGSPQDFSWSYNAKVDTKKRVAWRDHGNGNSNSRQEWSHQSSDSYHSFDIHQSEKNHKDWSRRNTMHSASSNWCQDAWSKSKRSKTSEDAAGPHVDSREKDWLQEANNAVSNSSNDWTGGDWAKSANSARASGKADWWKDEKNGWAEQEATAKGSTDWWLEERKNASEWGDKDDWNSSRERGKEISNSDGWWDDNKNKWLRGGWSKSNEGYRDNTWK